MRGLFFISNLRSQMVMEKKSVLFYRQFDRYSGGHQKVFDYFSHFCSTEDYEPAISFSNETLWDNSNPWFPRHTGVAFLPNDYDYLFLGGTDWEALSKYSLDPKKPVINLIQHVRHASPTSDVYPFLTNKAIRICVSPEVASALEGLVTGPLLTISNGVSIPEFGTNKVNDVFVAGFKNPLLAEKLTNHTSIISQTKHLSRGKFLRCLSEARISVLLPHRTEGFFLPALEAMQLSDIVIVPDCIGNRSFCVDYEKHGGNCIIPKYDVPSIVKAIQVAKQLIANKERLAVLKENALRTVGKHSLAAEREKFLKLMKSIDELWNAY